MNETLKRLGYELRRRYREALTWPMNWRMIDALVRLEEIDEQKSRRGDASAERIPPPAAPAPVGQPNDNIIDLPSRGRDRE